MPGPTHCRPTGCQATRPISAGSLRNDSQKKGARRRLYPNLLNHNDMTDINHRSAPVQAAAPILCCAQPRHNTRTAIQKHLPSRSNPAYASSVAETTVTGCSSPESEAHNSRAASRHARGFLLFATLWHDLSMGGPSGETARSTGPLTGLLTPLGSARPFSRGRTEITPSSEEVTP
jgi:hypothetical protein